MKKLKIYKNSDLLSTKRVSYILPTRNRAKYLQKSLGNYKKLLKHSDELIVIDGASADHTLDIIKKNSDFIDIFLSEPDAGHVHATNKGLIFAKGKYIKLLNDDDIFYPQAMEKAIKVMENHPEIDVLICGGIRDRKYDKQKLIVYLPPGTNFGKEIDDVFKYGANGIGYIIRRKALAKIGLFPFEGIADTTFIVNCFLNKAVVRFCRVKLYYQTVHKNSFTFLNLKKIASEHFRLRKKYASKQYFIPASINWFLWEHPNINKLVFIPLFFYKILKHRVLGDKRIKRKINYLWDGGLS